jgi:hypothetical protein
LPQPCKCWDYRHALPHLPLLFETVQSFHYLSPNFLNHIGPKDKCFFLEN